MAVPGERPRGTGGGFQWSRVGNTFTAAFAWSTCVALSAIAFLFAIGLGLQFREENRKLGNEGLQAARSLAEDLLTGRLPGLKSAGMDRAASSS